MLAFRIADLKLRMDVGGGDLKIGTPPSYIKFIDQPSFLNNKKTIDHEFLPNILYLKICMIPGVEIRTWHKLLHQDILWELWQDEAGRFVFVNLLEPGYYWAVIEPDFSRGEVFYDYSFAQQGYAYPLASLDLRIFVNWLGDFGDVILHASCIAVDGEGYCFVGRSGIGKSTLAGFLKQNNGFEVLGEDHVILRYIEEQFWVFGSPWHENPEMCSTSKVPLRKVFFLDRNLQPGTTQVKGADGASRILQTALIPYYRPELVERILERLTKLAVSVPFHTLSYQIGSDVWELIRNC